MIPTGDTSPNPVFYVVTMQVNGGGGGVVINDDMGEGCAPVGCLSLVETLSLTVRTFYLSDVDYVAEGGQNGTQAYLPLVSEAIDVNRTLALSPAGGGAQVTWGSLTLSNASGLWNGVFGSGNVSLLPLVVMAGMRTRDPVRGIDIDPPVSDLVQAFSGVGSDWTLADDALNVVLDDVTRYLSRYVTSQVQYAGTGGTSGNSSLAGRYAPTTRGGTAAAPIRNVTPVEVDAVNFVYQYNVPPGTVVALYVGGSSSAFPLATSVGNNGDVPDVYAASVPSGQYVTCNAQGLVRLGSLPVGAVTLDVTGAFPSGATPSAAFDVVRAVLVEELRVPAAMIDNSWFANAPKYYPDSNPAIGWYWSDGSLLVGQDMLNTLLSGLGMRLITTRGGLLRLQPLRAALFPNTPKGMLSEDQIGAFDTVALPSDIATPTWKWQIGFAHNFSVQTATDFNAQATADYRAFATVADRYATAKTDAVALAYGAPGVPAAIVTAMTSASDAAAVATAHQAMWGTRRRSFLLTIGRKIAIGYDIGDIVSVSWADAGIASAPAIVVGEQFKSDEGTTRLQVLI